MPPRRRRGFAVCAGSCLPSQILNKMHKIKGIPYVNSSFSCFCLLYKYWKTLGASAIKIDVSQKHRITSSQCDLLRRYIHKHLFFFFSASDRRNLNELPCVWTVGTWFCRKTRRIRQVCDSLILSVCLQREKKRFRKHDAAGGPHAIKKHHLLHNTLCLRRSGKPQSAAPQQVRRSLRLQVLGSLLTAACYWHVSSVLINFISNKKSKGRLNKKKKCAKWGC